MALLLVAVPSMISVYDEPSGLASEGMSLGLRPFQRYPVVVAAGFVSGESMQR
jgi:hypothetical protein